MPNTPTTAVLKKSLTLDSEDFTITLDGDNIVLKKGSDSVGFTKTQFDSGVPTETTLFAGNFTKEGTDEVLVDNSLIVNLDANNVKIKFASNNSPTQPSLDSITAGKEIKIVQSNDSTFFETGKIVSKSYDSTNKILTVEVKKFIPNGNTNSNRPANDGNVRIHIVTERTGISPNIVEIISEDTQVEQVLEVT